MARTPRKWTGARSPSGLKRVRTAERRHEVLGPRRSAAKTLVKNALIAATAPTEGVDAQAALIQAISALDRAAKVGAIHPNAAARRKSRLTRTVNAAVAGAGTTSSRAAKTIGKAAAQKAAKARIAASKADKAKGAQTAAGKARAALSKTSRAEAAAGAARAAAAAADADAGQAGREGRDQARRHGRNEGSREGGCDETRCQGDRCQGDRCQGDRCQGDRCQEAGKEAGRPKGSREGGLIGVVRRGSPAQRPLERPGSAGALPIPGQPYVVGAALGRVAPYIRPPARPKPVESPKSNVAVVHCWAQKKVEKLAASVTPAAARASGWLCRYR